MSRSRGNYLGYFIVILSSFILGVVSMKYGIISDIKRELFYSKDHSYLSNPQYLRNTELFGIYRLSHSEAVMIGDSITHNVNWNNLLDKNNIVNMGIPADTTAGILHRLEYIYKLNPKYVFIMSGINDIASGHDLQGTFNNYKKIITRLQNNNIVPIVQSTLLTWDENDNDKVHKLNSMLIEYCRINEVEFIDLNQKLSKDKKLIKDYSYDGVHLSAEGYEIWKKELEILLLKNEVH